MADIVLTIDPDDTSFALHDRANGRRLMGFDAPVPETDSQWAFSADTEGERRANLRYRNRVITAQVLLDRSTSVLLESLENTLSQKVGKLAREGGELRFTYPTGTAITFNVLEASMNRVFDIADMAKFRARYEISFICEPFGLGTEVDMGDNTETTLPVLIFTETGILGDVPGLGRLVVDNDETSDQWWAIWGVENNARYTHTSSSGDGALFYEAENLTPLGTSTVPVGSVTGASPVGAGSNVVRNSDLATVFQAILLNALPTLNYPSHVGTFRVFARVQVATTNVGDVTLALAWSIDDSFNVTINREVTIDEDQWVSSASWRLVDLGTVTIPSPRSGSTQQWAGRLLARSTVSGDDIDIDYLMYVPVDIASGEAKAIIQYQNPSTFSARDEFAQAAGALTGETLPVGGTWTGAGDADDFQNTGSTVTRTAVSDSAGEAMVNGRLAIAGSTNYTNIAVQVFQSATASSDTSSATWGVFARYTDANNWLVAQVTSPHSQTIIQIAKKVAGTSATLASIVESSPILQLPTVVKGMRLHADDQGRVFLWFWTDGYAPGSPILVAQHADLATGGTLATGKIGFVDYRIGSPATTRTYDNFSAFVPVKDAAAYGSQSLEIGPSTVMREDSTGAIWTRVSSYDGDYGRIPVAGAESRAVRTIVKMSRNDPTVMPDTSIDNISARLFVTPRFLVVPDA
jgi:hypothetical protein